MNPETYARVKAAGFGWAPKQECFFAVWTPNREDITLELADEIGDVHDGPVAIGADLLPALESLAIRTEMGGLEVGPDWLAFIGDYEFTGSLPDFAAIQ